MIKLTLKNFKCYENKTFVFDNGFVLIEGQSGTGKTSILQAIIFVLFGKGKNLKMNGKTSCSVNLEFEDINIFRSKNPNKLLVNSVLENDEAQNIINKKGAVNNSYIVDRIFSMNNLQNSNKKIYNIDHSEILRPKNVGLSADVKPEFDTPLDFNPKQNGKIMPFDSSN